MTGRVVHGSEPDPGDSAEQRAAEAMILMLASQRLGVGLQPQRLQTPAGRYVQVDGVADDRSVLAEVWAHQGAVKPAQRHKVLTDALKLHWVASFQHSRPRLVLCLCCHKAARSFLPGAKTWAAEALEHLDVTVEVFDLDDGGEVRRAQERQRR